YLDSKHREFYTFPTRRSSDLAGKKADIAIFDTRKPEWQPVLNPLANLVYSARGGADTVICNGRILMENDIVLSIDEKRAFAEAKDRKSTRLNSSHEWNSYAVI